MSTSATNPQGTKPGGFFRSLLRAAVLSGVGLATVLSVILTMERISTWWFIIPPAVALILVVTSLWTVGTTVSVWHLQGSALLSTSSAGMLIVGVLLLVWSIPVLVLLLVMTPQSSLRSVRIAVFFVSVGFALVYFVLRRSRFPTITDRLTYFGTVCIVPATAVGFFE